MAAKIIGRATLLASSLAIGLGVSAPVLAQNFTMRTDYAVVYTPFHPNGEIDPAPPFTVCRNNQIGFRFRYTWRNGFQEYVYTEPGSEFFPYFYMQGVNPNPVYLPAAGATGPVVRNVDVGLISGSVNTGGSRQLMFRGRTSGFFGNPVSYATATVLVETQIEPLPIHYREMADGVLDMPTQPWFGWSPGIADSYRLDVGKCSNGGAALPENCGTTSMPGAPLTETCDGSDYCWIGNDPEHQTVTALLPDKAYNYRVLGRNVCGISNEFDQTPPRPFFRTAQACFVVNGNIPDGGSATFDAAVMGPNPGSSVPNLRVTVHADHPDVNDLRISLTKIAPVTVGPLTLMDRPSATNCTGPRVQAAFADGGSSLLSGCNGQEPAVSGKVAPVQSLSSFSSVVAEGVWRLTVVDAEADGHAGTLREWCLSSDVPLTATQLVNPNIMLNGFE